MNFFKNRFHSQSCGRYSILFFCCTLLYSAFFTVSAWGHTQDMRFDRFTIEQGLSQSSVTSILKDQDGFMWVGTYGGLNRYDGYSFTVFQHNPQNPYSISDSDIRSIYEDSSGTLWIGTRNGGLNRFDKKTERFITYKYDPNNTKSLSSNTVWSIMEDSKGRLWIGTEDGLNHFDRTTGHFMQYKMDNITGAGLQHSTIWTMMEDSKDGIWIGTGKGLHRLDPDTGNFTYYIHHGDDAKSIRHDSVVALYEDKKQRLWVGTEDGLNLFDPEDGSFITYKNDPQNAYSLHSNKIWSITEDSRGDLCIATDKGLHHFDEKNNRFYAYTHSPFDSNSLSNNRVFSLYRDDQDALWIGTEVGLNKLDYKRQKFGSYSHHPANLNSLSMNDVWSIYEDREGMIWIGTKGEGLNRLDRNQGIFTHYNHDPESTDSISHDSVVSIWEDYAGILWLGTRGGGLNAFDRKTGKFIRYRHAPEDEDTISNDTVRALYEDSKGRLWVGTDEGLNRFDQDTQRFIRYQKKTTNPHSISHNQVVFIYEDKDHFLWIGTLGGGLNRFDPETEKFIPYIQVDNDPRSISHNSVWAILEDRKGNFWVGTLGGGLNLFDRAQRTFTRFSQKDGLPDDNILGILEDTAGFLWISTNKGISKFDPVSQQFRNYTVSDGLQGTEFNPGACFKSSTGEMFFGGDDGFNFFYPEHIKDNTYQPPIKITAFRKFDKIQYFGEAIYRIPEIRLSYKDTFFSFEFAALDYTISQKNQYAYKLEGFDQEWVYCGTRRYASYTNLNGGKYTFRVKGANSDGVWNEEGTFLTILITPPWWKTWWAYTVYIILLVSLISITIYLITSGQQKELQRQKVTVESLKRVDKMKDEFLANTSHELRTPLNGMIGIAESLIDGAAGDLSEVTTRNLSMIVLSGKRLATLVNDILDMSKLNNQQLILQLKPVDLWQNVELVMALSRPLVKDKVLQLINEVDERLPLVYADEKRLQQIMHNLIGNAAKFTEQGSIQVYAEIEDDKIAVTIEDTGIGIPEDKLEDIFRSFQQVDASTAREYGGTGLGLSITKHLVELHGGIIQVDSQVGKGTRFTFTLPFSPIQQRVEQDAIREASVTNMNTFAHSHVEFLPTASESTRMEQQSYNNEALRILVADDEPVNLQVMVNQLGLQKYQVDTACNGMDALDKIQKGDPYHLIILDVMMPKMTGYEVCRILREEHTMFELPILMLTAKNQPEDIIVGLEAGANDYLSKPFDKRELLTRVQTLLTLKQAVQDAITNAQRFESEREKRKLSETLRIVTNTLSSTLNLSEVLNRLLENLAQIVPYDCATVMLRQGEYFQVVAAKGHEDMERVQKLRIPVATDLLFHEAVKNNRPIIIDHVQDNPMFHAFGSKNKVQCWIGVPLLSRNQALGILTLDSNALGAYTENEADIAFTFASQAAIAIENAKLFGKVKKLATTDGLTGLYNRRYFFKLGEHICKQSLESKVPLSVIMFDIDHFKRFNDTYGHAMGDEVLRVVAARCLEISRKTDIVGRYGGEEFVILLPQTPLSIATDMAEKLRSIMADVPIPTEAYGALQVTISIGVADLRKGFETLSDILNIADEGLYEAKRSGRNKVVTM